MMYSIGSVLWKHKKQLQNVATAVFWDANRNIIMEYK